MPIRKWPIKWVTVIAAIDFLRTAVDGRLAPYVVEWPHRLTSAALAAYVNQTFGSHQRCLNVAFDDTAEAAAIVAMLYCHRLYRQPRERDSGAGGQPNHENCLIAAVTARTIELNESWDSPAVVSCSAYVVVGRRLDVVMNHMENFRNGAAERMLVVVVQNRKYIKPFMKYTPKYFNYKDIILISVYPEKETVYQMSIYHEKFIPISKQQDKWFKHDLRRNLNIKNFYGTHIKLLAYNNSFFSQVITNYKTGKLSLSNGVECSIFKEIAMRLNITWDVYTTEDKDKWGTVWENNTITGGALKLLFNKRVDASFCSLWIEHKRVKFVDMSKFWTLMCLKFLVLKPKPLREKWDLLFKPFPLSIWLLVFLSATFTIITVWTLAGIQKRMGYDRINAFTSLSSTIYWIIGMMLLTNIPRTYQTGPIRHMINWWCIFVFIMTTSFSSILYSYITSPKYTDIALEIEDMVKANYYWGLTYPPPFNDILKMQNPVHRAFSERFVAEQTANDRVSRIKSGRYAVLTKCLYGKHFMESETVPAALLNDLRTARTCVSQFYIGLSFVKHSPYTKPANLVIQRIFESGLIDYWLSRVTEVRLPPATFKQVYEIKPRHTATANSVPLPLSFRQFKVVVVVWMAGCAVSAIVFAAELRYHYRVIARLHT